MLTNAQALERKSKALVLDAVKAYDEYAKERDDALATVRKAEAEMAKLERLIATLDPDHKREKRRTGGGTPKRTRSPASDTSTELTASQIQDGPILEYLRSSG